MKKFIIVKLKLEGVHAWKTCNIEEVMYLKDTHRHTFGFTCCLEVSHNDRDVEFIEFQHQIRNYLRLKYYDDVKFNLYDFTGKSCEMLAEELAREFNLAWCEVDEDGEFFGRVES